METALQATRESQPADTDDGLSLITHDDHVSRIP